MDYQISISSFKSWLTQFLIFVFLTVTLPLSILLVVCVLLYRTAVKYAAKVFRKDLSNMVTSNGNIYAGDKFRDTPMCNQVIVLIMEGTIDREKVKQAFLNTVLKPTEEQSNYHELKQYHVKWGGYHFWSTDKNFSIDNHLKVIDDNSTLREDELNQLCQECVSKNWEKSRSPWEMKVAKNYIPSDSSSGPHSALIWTSHHCLADGYSLLYLFTESLNQNKIVTAAPTVRVPTRNFVQTLAYVIMFPFNMLWEFSEAFMVAAKSFSFDAPKERSKVEQLVTDISPLLPTSKVKYVKNHYAVSFSAVQFAALAGAVREYHLNRKMPVPEFYPCMIPLPHSGHKLYKLRNYIGCTQTFLPTHEKDMYKRLLCAQRDFLRIKKSTFPVASFYVFSLIGCCPRVLVKHIVTKHCVFPMTLSSFPAGLEQGYFLGHKMKECLSYTGPLEGNSGLEIVTVSYLDGFRITGTARSSVMSTNDVTEITSLFVKHIDELHKMAMRDEKKKNFETV